MRASGVYDHAPLEDAESVSAKIEEKDPEETSWGNFSDCGAKRCDRKKVNQQNQKSERKNPANGSEEPAGRFAGGLVGALHEPDF